MKIVISAIILLVLLGVGFLVSCKNNRPTSTAQEDDIGDSLKTLQPAWAKNAVIYEVNVRQYTPEGTFAAFAQHLNRLEAMGIDILWFMPIHPISKKKRKGSMGSYYAVSDYRKVNPEFGTKEAFQSLIENIHARGMKIILDWIPHHTGWDHPWIERHPDFYTADEKGNIVSPINPEAGKSEVWTDVAKLNYDNPEMRRAMIEDMRYWINEMNIDGFRMDVAHGVPADFWDEASSALRADANVFLLAEAEVPELRNAGYFAVDYGWRLYHLLNDIAQGKKTANAIAAYYRKDCKLYHRGYHMNFITNHDENTWNGTEYERMGAATDAMAAFTFTYCGMPLIYSGQESAFDRRLKFFEKDSITWANYPKMDFYKKLIALKHANRALWNGEYGGKPRRINTDKDKSIYAFKRQKNGDSLIAVFNMSNENQEVTLDATAIMGTYNNVFAGSTMNIAQAVTLSMAPWEYLVLSNK